MINDQLKSKEETLKKFLSQFNKACIGFSGGVDSTLLLYLASQVIPVIAVTADGIMMTRDELEEALNFSDTLSSVEHITFSVDPLEIENFRNNTPDRCYACKKTIFSKISDIASQNNCDVIFDGANVDDLGDYRPGMKAVKELGVVSPFLEANFSKSDIYDLSKKYQLPTMNKASAACLASRVPTGEPITAEKLEKVEKAEKLLKEYGFRQLRLRLFNGTEGKIECLEDDFNIFFNNKKELKERLAQIGVELNDTPKAYTQGSMNQPN